MTKTPFVLEAEDRGRLRIPFLSALPLPHCFVRKADVQDVEAMNQAFPFPPASSVDPPQEKRPLDRLQAPELANVAGGFRVGNSAFVYVANVCRAPSAEI